MEHFFGGFEKWKIAQTITGTTKFTKTIRAQTESFPEFDIQHISQICKNVGRYRIYKEI